jgi:hypothetical protein
MSGFHYEETLGGTSFALVINQCPPATVTGTRVQNWPAHFGAAAIASDLIGVRLSRPSSDPTVSLAALPKNLVADATIFRAQSGFAQHTILLAREILAESRVLKTNWVARKTLQ